MTAYKADSIGIHKKEVDEILEKKFDEKMNVDEAIHLAVECLRTTQEEKLIAENMEISYVTTRAKQCVTLPDREVAKHLK